MEGLIQEILKSMVLVKEGKDDTTMYPSIETMFKVESSQLNGKVYLFGKPINEPKAKHQERYAIYEYMCHVSRLQSMHDCTRLYFIVKRKGALYSLYESVWDVSIESAAMKIKVFFYHCITETGYIELSFIILQYLSSIGTPTMYYLKTKRSMPDDIYHIHTMCQRLLEQVNDARLRLLRKAMLEKINNII